MNLIEVRYDKPVSVGSRGLSYAHALEPLFAYKNNNSCSVCIPISFWSLACASVLTPLNGC